MSHTFTGLALAWGMSHAYRLYYFVKYSNGFTHIPGTHLDDPRRKQRLCGPARVAVRRAPSPLLSINIYY